MDDIFKLLGQAFAYCGVGAAVAYLLFQYLGKKWIENKFMERLEQLRHSQALELQRLKVEIDFLLNGAIRLQEKEFQILPEAWAKLDKAFKLLALLVCPTQRHKDLDQLDNSQFEDFLAETDFTKTEKNSLRQEGGKNEKYKEIRFWHCLCNVRSSIAEFHDYVEHNSIFMPPGLKSKFEKAADDLWSAMRNKEVGHKERDWKMENESWNKVKDGLKSLREEIEKAIYARLQENGNRKSLL